MARTLRSNPLAKTDVVSIQRGAGAVARKDFQQLKVLVVDGNAHMRQVLRRHLYALTIDDIREAATGKEVLRLLRGFYPDLIICDLESERVGGIELVIRIRTGTAGVDPLVPLITVTGAIDVAEVRTLCEAGADVLQPRPIMLRRLYLAIVDALGCSRGASAPTQGRGQGAEAYYTKGR